MQDIRIPCFPPSLSSSSYIMKSKLCFNQDDYFIVRFIQPFECCLPSTQRQSLLPPVRWQSLRR